jgi:hypothetical protein
MIYGDGSLKGFLELESFLFLAIEVSKGGSYPALFFSSLDQDDHTTEELH